MRLASIAENSFNAVERIDEIAHVAEEAVEEVKDAKPDGWPSSGQVSSLCHLCYCTHTSAHPASCASSFGGHAQLTSALACSQALLQAADMLICAASIKQAGVAGGLSRSQNAVQGGTAHGPPWSFSHCACRLSLWCGKPSSPELGLVPTQWHPQAAWTA